MNRLLDMPNIGKELDRQLKKVGVDTPDRLIEIGSKEAFRKIRKIDESACLNRLYALEGAIQGVRWHGLSKEKKEDLKGFFQSQKD